MKRRFAAAMALLCSLGAVAHSQTWSPRGKAVVRDANNQKVGTVWDFSPDCCSSTGPSHVSILASVDGHPIPLNVNASDIDCGNHCDPEIFFASSDCSGPPLLNVVEPTMTVRYTITGPGRTLYYANQNIPEQPATASSTYMNTYGSCVTLAAQSLTVQPAQSLDLDARFAPPFRVAPR